MVYLKSVSETVFRVILLLLVVLLMSFSYAMADTETIYINYDDYEDCGTGNGCDGVLPGGSSYSIMYDEEVLETDFIDPLPEEGVLTGVSIVHYGIGDIELTSAYFLNDQLIEEKDGFDNIPDCECPTPRTYSRTGSFPEYNYGSENTFRLEADNPGCGSCHYAAEVTFTYTSEAKIPTLNEWGMIILSLLMAGSAFWFIRKKSHNSC